MNTRSFGLYQQSVRSDLRADDLTETSEPFGLNQQSVRSDLRADDLTETSKPEAKEGTKTLSETWKEETDKSDVISLTFWFEPTERQKRPESRRLDGDKQT
jgi:hypothetical protein